MAGYTRWAVACSKPEPMGHRSILRLTVPVVMLAVVLSATSGCRLTDHSERDDVTSDMLKFPASGHEGVDPDDLPQIRFDSTTLDMGVIVQGAKVTKYYTFTNPGGAPLVISDVRGSCGCTVGKNWPREPIAPGKGGTIEVSFDSEGRSGHQSKTVTVVANTVPPTTALVLTGDVAGPATIPAK